MRKFLILLLLLSGTWVAAQEDDYAGGDYVRKESKALQKVADATRLGLFTNLSIPSGAYASENLSRDNSGYARDGFSLMISLDYMFGKNIGIGLEGDYSFHPFNSNPFLDQVRDDPGFVSFTTDNWTSSSIALTFDYSFDFDRTEIFIRPKFGLVQLKSPEQTLEFLYLGSSYTNVWEETTVAAYGYGGALGYRLHFHKLHLQLHTDVRYSEHSYIVDITVPGVGVAGQVSFTQPMLIYRLGFGIGYYLQ